MITVVSGLSRSGTSMMMLMLKTGGLPTVSDGGDEHADSDNPNGYYECTGLLSGLQKGDLSTLDNLHGKCVKILARFAINLPVDQSEYRVIWMDRPVAEVKASRDKSFAILPPKPWVSHPMASVGTEVLEDVRLRALAHWIRLRTRLLVVRYHDVLQHPEAEVDRLKQFIPELSHLDTLPLIVDPILCHHGR